MYATQITADKSIATDLSPDTDIDLKHFFPYLVRIYYRAVSEAISNVCSSQFKLTVSEWRTMAVLGPTATLSAREIVTRSSMNKMKVSRAIKGLQAAGFLRRDIDGQDKRLSVLRLTETGVEAFELLVPLVKQVEEQLLMGLSQTEISTLISLMQKVRLNAENLSTASRLNQKERT